LFLEFYQQGVQQIFTDDNSVRQAKYHITIRKYFLS
jgi:hypothetical protein